VSVEPETPRLRDILTEPKESIMKTISCSLLATVAVAAMLPLAARAETPMGVTSLAEAKALYEQDIAACKAGAVPEDRRTCLIEAKRAYEEARREAMQHERAQRQGKAPPDSQR
jgi:hypothetical protein